jgi:ribosomal-protein-alanine N-acetyltransferase
MSDGLIIRRGTSSDTGAIAGIGLATATAPRWQVSDYSQIVLTGRTLLVAEAEGEVAGFLIARDIAGEWELENIVVADAHRRRGIGKRLLWELVIEARRCNANVIFLEVRESNFSARKLYERCGFQQNGRRTAYYSNPQEDALLYCFWCSSETRENC